ncbi:MAG: SRPBCC family protein [Gaiellaceae bacterium MAG52_C11]|nr:SRPBCC family protein [Candidatus Gaiellasilicea maunaloa]
MSKVEESIELEVPVRTAYNQWTQFEEFPQFMEHVDEVKQLDDEHLHWKVTIAGKTEEFDAEVAEQIPDTRIAWRSTSGRQNSGAVDFHPLGDNRSQIMVALDAETEGAMEKAADASGFAARQLRGDLKRFKELIEQQGSETGAWRGIVERDAS